MQIKIKLRLNPSRWKLSRSNDNARCRADFTFPLLSENNSQPVSRLNRSGKKQFRDTRRVSRILETRDISEICKMVNGKRKLVYRGKGEKAFVGHTSTSGNELLVFELSRSGNVSRIFSVIVLL